MATFQGADIDDTIVSEPVSVGGASDSSRVIPSDVPDPMSGGGGDDRLDGGGAEGLFGGGDRNDLGGQSGNDGLNGGVGPDAVILTMRLSGASGISGDGIDQDNIISTSDVILV